MDSHRAPAVGSISGRCEHEQWLLQAAAARHRAPMRPDPAARRRSDLVEDDFTAEDQKRV